ncbi:TPA: hypothetical protein ACS73Q_000352 [Providencia alcalifaciens]|uniref:hypothetical protein n=1 Tax=Providencia alcalifaciens TaxID=126385 RepID=UPI0004484F92|nr:hypothetical protein [Providencia alcalifaciens]EUD03203.1 LysR substrate-binding domain protein [Providencia alcalifaciens RIMD 1656011]
MILRLPNFYLQHPDIEISVSTSHSSEAKGLSGFTVLIRRDALEKPEWRYFDRRPLFEEKLTLVASPTLSHDLNKKRLQAPFQVQVTGSQYAALVAPDVDKSLSLTLFLEWLEQEALK